MIEKNRLGLSIVICSIRISSSIHLLELLKEYMLVDDEIILIFDIYIPLDKVQHIKKNLAYENIFIRFNNENLGLSFCRNFGMSKAKNDYIIFFDDDVVIINDIISSYRDKFLCGSNIIGGPLTLPKSYPNLPYWLPLGFSSLLGIHTVQNRIWGGNFGFNLKLAKMNRLKFNDRLGRKGGKLQSGDDSDFVLSYSKIIGSQPIFFEDLIVEHHIDINRYKVKYLLRRSFWQGRSEVRKNTIISGFKKEIMRSLQRSDVAFPRKIAQNSITIIILTSFTVGVLMELIFSPYKK